MIDYDNLYHTSVYNWTILTKNSKEEVYTLHCKTWDGWAVFTYYKSENIIYLLKNIRMYCPSFERANKLVYDTLIVHKWQIHPRYLGRYFKMKKISGKEIEHNIMELNHS